MIFYGLKNCDTCRKAFKAIEAKGISVTYVDVRADGVAHVTLEQWVQKFGPENLVNRRSTTWRGLNEAQKAQALEAENTAQILVENPTLMKRPVIEAETDVLLGWTPQTQSKLGL